MSSYNALVKIVSTCYEMIVELYASRITRISAAILYLSYEMKVELILFYCIAVCVIGGGGSTRNYEGVVYYILLLKTLY